MKPIIHHLLTRLPKATRGNRTEPNIHDMLSKHHQIAVIWSVDDVHEERPDLNDEQAWNVLQRMHRHHDACIGINWDVIRITADEMFPDAEDDYKQSA